MTARVFLGDVLVGHIDLDSETHRADFYFDAVYLATPDRPVLGRYFEDRELSPHEPIRSSSAPLHEFFLNALPEGALRKVIEGTIARGPTLELDLLCKLGGDLPGCLRVVPDLVDVESPDVVVAARTQDTRPDPLRFSLAGLQLKASVLREERKVTLPLVGCGGTWIAKFPSAVYADLPENEHAVMTWARASGLDVPLVELVDVVDIENLPDAFPRHGRALLVERFDRRDGGCLHQEDVLQVFGIHPDLKLMNDLPDEIHYASLGRLVATLTRALDADEYLRRLAFMLLSGNTDAHAKNWAFTYPDALHPRLSPAYDLVCVEPYGQDTLALGWGPPVDPDHTPEIPLDSIGRSQFGVIATAMGRDPDEVVRLVDVFTERAEASWSEVRGRETVPEPVRACIDRRIAAFRSS
jgi:serine/threonine-protein kinase HipA